MGSLENGVLLKKDQHHSHNIGRVSSFSKQQRPRSRFPRFLLSKRIGYLQWISTIVVFSLFLVFFQAFLPGSVVERPGNSRKTLDLVGEDLMYLNRIIKELDFGEDVRFEPTRLSSKFQKEAAEVNSSSGFKRGIRFGHRKPKLALVFADLGVDPYQILMATVGTALQEIGYTIEVFSSEDGPAHTVWQHIGVPVTTIEIKDHCRSNVDWLNYDGILLNSLEGKEILSCFMQEPFKSLPLVWTIHEDRLATRLNQYTVNGTVEILNDWKKSFSRATVVVFPNYALPMIYSKFDTGNYLVVPGSPTEAWEADSLMSFNQEQVYAKMGFAADDFVIAVVGSQFMYKGLWLEQALILQALKPLLTEFLPDDRSDSGFKLIILTGDSEGNYTKAVEAISTSLDYPKGIVKHVDRDASADDVLGIANLVIYGSFLEEQSFPDILIKSMCYEKLIIAPNLSMIQKYVDDRVNGYLFPKEDIKVLTAIVSQVVSRGRLSPLAHNVASIGKETAKNLKSMEAVEGYASLLENILKLPSEVAVPKSASEIPSKYKNEWRWNILKMIPDAKYRSRNLKDRSDQPRGTWEDVYRSSRRADHMKNDLHERDDGELERTGQPLCIYEPYFGEGTWPFLHHKPLYRGIGLASRGRRRGTDDVDASSRLSLLSNPYYRDALGEFGAFFAIANRVDRVHKNAWIGFQSWRATARKKVLSKTAEKALLKAIETGEHGDTFYFWVRLDSDPRNPMNKDFWSFCDAVNAGNCRSAFSDAFKKMYGIKQDWDSLPPMPMDGDTWSVMHSWSLPTRSFLEYVMFARMFVDALDAQMYEEHHRSGHCYLSLTKDKHCYSRVLELLINVWAYHSARHMVYIDPETGKMQEQHGLQNRRGHMWLKFFSLRTLKSMDEELAEEADSEQTKRHWLWPKTGEIFWQGSCKRSYQSLVSTLKGVYFSLYYSSSKEAASLLPHVPFKFHPANTS
uniref:Glycosyl transferase family 1 domain-containing protein n=1 Tax=Chenopodium quinoa TaxID=63459 RepID=A0A803M337_CHEQI